MTDLLPLGTLVTLLADTFGPDAMTGTIAGYVAYTYPGFPEGGRMDQGYALHLDHGFYGGPDNLPVGKRPWIGSIVVHVDSVERLMPDLSMGEGQ